MLRFRIPGLGKGFALALMTVVILLAAANQVQAQTLRLGPKAGVTSAWFSGSDWNDQIDFYDSTIRTLHWASASNAKLFGCFGGGFLEIGLRPSFAVQIELLIGTLSGGLTVEYGFTPSFPRKENVSQRATVLTLPLLLKPKFDVGDSGAIYGLVGPEPGFIVGDVQLRGKEVIEFAADDVSPDNRFVFSATIGAGYERRFDSGALNAEIRYSRTFTSVFDKDSTSSPLGYGNTRINSFNLFVGYGFDL